MTTFQEQFDWQNRYMVQVTKILRAHIGDIIKIDIAPEDDDMKRATDVTIKLSGGSVAVRLRKETKYRDLTIRSYNGGYKTEIDKIREGCADWYFYGWTKNGKVIDWILVSVNQLRDNGVLDADWREISNKDGRTKFICIPRSYLFQNGYITAHG